jgi:hypothetical protein
MIAIRRCDSLNNLEVVFEDQLIESIQFSKHIFDYGKRSILPRIDFAVNSKMKIVLAFLRLEIVIVSLE